MIYKNGKVRAMIVGSKSPDVTSLMATLQDHFGLETFLAQNTRDAMSQGYGIQPDLVIVDHVPGSVDGLRFCSWLKSTIRTEPPYLILLVDAVAREAKVEALALGIDDYLEKPLVPELITAKLSATLRIVGLTRELHEDKARLVEASLQLEKNFKELTEILVKVLDTRIPGTADRAKVAKSLAEFMATHLELSIDEKKRLAFFAVCHEIGKAGLADEVLKEDHHEERGPLRDAYRYHPATGALIISAVSGWGEKTEDFYHQLENYDGSGCPDGLMAEQIPLGARILRAIVLQENLFAQGLTHEQVIQAVRDATWRILDGTTASLLVQYLTERSSSVEPNARKVSVDDLEQGMMVAADIYSVQGLKLLPKGVRLHQRVVDVLKERNLVDPVLGGVYVFNA